MKLSAVCFRSLLMGLAVTAMQGLSYAGLVTGVSSSNNLAATVTGVSGISHTAPVFGVNSGTVTIDLEVFQLHTPILLNFAYGSGGADTVTDYTVTLNVKNSVPTTVGGFNFQGFDVTRSVNTSGSVVSTGPRANVTPTSDWFYLDYSGVFNITNGFRWGGLNGGGARLTSGSTSSNTFMYRVTWDGTTVGGSSALNFVANPEPTTLLLGSLLLAPAALMMRRRRKNAVVEEVPEA